MNSQELPKKKEKKKTLSNKPTFIDSDFFQLKEEIFSSEFLLRQRLQNVLSVLKLMDLIDEFQKTFSDVDLDQKQAFVNAFLTLQREAE